MSTPPQSIRVLYDHQVFTWQNFGGISRYHAALLAELHQSGYCSPRLSLTYSNNAHIGETPYWKDTFKSKSAAPLPFWARFTRKNRKRFKPDALNRASSIAALLSADHDIVHPTYYDPYFIDHLQGKPYVITVHDMIHELFPEYYLEDTISSGKEAVIRRADRIISISHSTKRDLVEIYGVSPEKIDVVYHGIALRPVTCCATPLDLPSKFFLHVGHRSGYKNAYFLLRALREILRVDTNLHIVFAGGGRFTTLELRFIEMLGLSRQVHYREAHTPNLVTLYQRTIALVCPSLYEGFGLPLIEAFNCGCPVIASSTPAHAEVAGDAALYFEPKNAPSVVDAITRVLKTPDLLHDLRSRGTRRATEFSPKKCAQETAAVYARVLGKAPGPS